MTVPLTGRDDLPEGGERFEALTTAAELASLFARRSTVG